MKKPLVSIIIPLRTITPYAKETILSLKRQSYKNFEIIILPDNEEKVSGAKVVVCSKPGPAEKRNMGAKVSKGEILGFLDDDSYPSENWLKEAVSIFEKSEEITGACGPCLTPPKDSIFQKASGLVWSSWIGSGGAGTYRNRKEKSREVDDFPSVNLLVRKKDFQKVGGFDIHHWPGEDTKLCLDLVYGLKKKIIYDPRILVYHHRRAVLIPHLKQISRYALRRGFFAKKFSKTSFRLGYLAPSIFAYGIIAGAIIFLINHNFGWLYFSGLYFYFSVLILTGLDIFLKEKNIILSVLTILTIFATHFTYGLLFPFGYFQKDMGVVPRNIDIKKKLYLGG